jgi:phospholipid/cholesterol/gamma-HCH transport system permease protein
VSVDVIYRQRFPRTVHVLEGVRTGLRQIGDQVRFSAETLGSLVDVFARYRGELLRQIAAMGLGTGALAVLGGTVAIMAFLSMTGAGVLAVQIYNELTMVGVEALNGFATAFVATREVIPLMAVFAFASTIGAGTTAQLGAMRINEEIDALEVMGVNSIAYLASTRVAAGMIVVVPLYSVALVLGYLSGEVITTIFYGQSNGVYQHYFNTFFSPIDVIRSYLATVAEAMAIMLIHTYYGFTAKGGPAGVGEAVGRAVRLSLIAATCVIVMVTLAAYGRTGDFNFAG